MPELTYDQKLVDYATATKASAGTIYQIENGDFVKHWCEKLRGNFIQVGPTWKAATKQQAIEKAREFRE